MKQFLVGVLLGLLLIALLFVIRPGQADAAPRYGQSFNSRHGHIVWVRGDWAYSRVHCTWNTRNGRSWRFSWLMKPYQYSWTTTDAGSWGNSRAYNLNCTYRRV